jgi:hypothetical protein
VHERRLAGPTHTGDARPPRRRTSPWSGISAKGKTGNMRSFG